MRKPTEGTAPTDLQTYTPSARTLLTEEVISAHDVTKSWLEDNIMKDGGLEFINAEFAKQVRNDLIDLAFNGDGSTPGFLACNKGWIQLLKDGTTGFNKVDIPAANVDYDVNFGLLYASLPDKYKADTSEFKFWVPVAVWDGYKDQLKARNSGLGDQIITGNAPVYWKGIEVVPMAKMPASHYMLVLPKNLHIGFHRDVTMDIMWQPRKRVYEVTITARVDFEFAIAEQIVLGYDITP